jgi:hypothetical protein
VTASDCGIRLRYGRARPSALSVRIAACCDKLLARTCCRVRLDRSASCAYEVQGAITAPSPLSVRQHCNGNKTSTAPSNFCKFLSAPPAALQPAQLQARAALLLLCPLPPPLQQCCDYCGVKHLRGHKRQHLAVSACLLWLHPMLTARSPSSQARSSSCRQAPCREE